MMASQLSRWESWHTFIPVNHSETSQSVSSCMLKKVDSAFCMAWYGARPRYQHEQLDSRFSENLVCVRPYLQQLLVKIWWWCKILTNTHAPASLMRQGHGIVLVEVKVCRQLPQMWLGLWRLVNLEEKVYGILPVGILETEGNCVCVRSSGEKKNRNIGKL